MAPVAIVTGATSGIGTEIARGLAESGTYSLPVILYPLPVAKNQLPVKFICRKLVNMKKGHQLILSCRSVNSGERLLKEIHRTHPQSIISIRNGSILNQYIQTISITPELCCINYTA